MKRMRARKPATFARGTTISSPLVSVQCLICSAARVPAGSFPCTPPTIITTGPGSPLATRCHGVSCPVPSKSHPPEGSAPNTQPRRKKPTPADRNIPLTFTKCQQKTYRPKRKAHNVRLHISNRKKVCAHHLFEHEVRARYCDWIERKCKISGFSANKLRKLTGISNRFTCIILLFQFFFPIDLRASVY